MEMDEDGEEKKKRGGGGKEGGHEEEETRLKRIPAYLQTTTQHFACQCQHVAANDWQINSL